MCKEVWKARHQEGGARRRSEPGWLGWEGARGSQGGFSADIPGTGSVPGPKILGLRGKETIGGCSGGVEEEEEDTSGLGWGQRQENGVTTQSQIVFVQCLLAHVYPSMNPQHNPAVVTVLFLQRRKPIAERLFLAHGALKLSPALPWALISEFKRARSAV